MPQQPIAALFKTVFEGYTLETTVAFILTPKSLQALHCRRQTGGFLQSFIVTFATPHDWLDQLACSLFIFQLRVIFIRGYMRRCNFGRLGRGF